MGNVFFVFNLLISIVLVFGITYFRKRVGGLSNSILLSLFLGGLWGSTLLFLSNVNETAVQLTTQYLSIIGSGYMRALQMISLPLIITSILHSLVNINHMRNFVKTIISIISILLGITFISSIIAIFVTSIFNLNFRQLLASATNNIDLQIIKNATDRLGDETIIQRFIEFIPTNVFYDLTGARSQSTLAIVLFCSLIGFSVISIKSKDTRSLIIFEQLIGELNRIVMKLVSMIIYLAPYSMFAMIAVLIVNTNLASMLELLRFLIVSYIVMIIVYIIHLLIIYSSGISIKEYFKMAVPTLLFAFMSRSSAATLPLNIQAQKDLGVEKSISSISGTLGLTIGQNGCAGIYPAMLVAVLALNDTPFRENIPYFIFISIFIALSSFGIAGVGGGATLSAIVVLSSLNLPVGIVALLISIEPLIDMGRTALNVSGSMISGIVTTKILERSSEYVK